VSISHPASDGTAQDSFGERYELRAVLGQGGMAKVFRVFDRVRKQEVALKQLTVSAERSSAAALFEREFRTLAQLRHPNVIAVYDYYVPIDAGPFYTMELLDGGELLERTPMAWRDACAVMADVCSALGLLHSRGLLHRDISPRNIHQTHTGRAKLIDFGAMGPMSHGGAQVVGTPAFCAPETLHKLALDARTDLYSLGVTLYYVLTGGLPYPGRTFADMLLAWTTKVAPPSALKPDLPAALDDIVLQLIHPEPELRPASAYVVMQRLQAIAGLAAREAESVPQAYLVTPSLVGRTELLDELRKQLMNARLQRGAGALIEGASGSGRSRLLDACALEAKTLGFHVLRATCTASGQVFGVAQALVQHLLEAWPHAVSEPDAAVLFEATSDRDQPVWKSFAAPDMDPTAVQRAFFQLLLRVSRSRPLLLAVDDIHRIDSPSAAVLAALLDHVEAHFFVALTSDSAEPESEAKSALARRCQRLEPAPLTHAETQQLLVSLFGDVPHLAGLTEEIYKLAAGNPRMCVDLAQHLLDRGVVRYDSGIWILPQTLSAANLPRDVSAALRARSERLSPEARWLAQAHALAYFETLRDQDYHALRPDLSSAQVEQALAELLALQVLVRAGQRYSLANRAWSAALTSHLTTDELVARHRALHALYAGKIGTAEMHHAFCAGLDEEALGRLVQRHSEYDAKKHLDPKAMIDEDTPKVMWIYDRAIATALRLGRSKRLVNDLRRWWMAGSILQEWGLHTESCKLWFDQLAHDSGLTLYREDTQSKPEERLTHALQTAYQRYMATPEAERVYAVDEAIRFLAEYVVYSIALASRAGDVALLRELPAILQPFAVLSPVLDAIWNNAIATYSMAFDCNFESAHARWTDVLAKLDAVSGGEMQHIEPIRNAVVYALSLTEVQLGLKTADELVARLDSDPYQGVAALTMRRVMRLQQGDYRGADVYRRRAELLALELRWPQMFKSTLTVEAWTYAQIGDLAGLRDVIEQLRELAAHFPAWQPALCCVEGAFHQVRGDFEAAKSKYEECLTVVTPDERGAFTLGAWLSAQSGVAETLFELGRLEEAQRVAAVGVELCRERKLVSAGVDLVRILALTEGKLGLADAAAARLDALIAQQRGLGTTGLRMGLSYEARARIALWKGDSEAFETFARLTAQEYRHGARSPLGARYELLVNEAKRVGIRGGPALSELIGASVISSHALMTQDLLTIVARNMTGKSRASERADTALSLLCASRNARAGHLFLCSDSGLVLSASQGPAPEPQLTAAAESFLEAGSERTHAISDMATGELSEEAEVTIVQCQDLSYELLLLSCLVDGKNTPVAVAAVPVSDVVPDSLKQAQLLQVLAGHLHIRAGNAIE